MAVSGRLPLECVGEGGAGCAVDGWYSIQKADKSGQ